MASGVLGCIQASHPSAEYSSSMELDRSGSYSGGDEPERYHHLDTNSSVCSCRGEGCKEERARNSDDTDLAATARGGQMDDFPDSRQKATRCQNGRVKTHVGPPDNGFLVKDKHLGSDHVIYMPLPQGNQPGRHSRRQVAFLVAIVSLLVLLLIGLVVYVIREAGTQVQTLAVVCEPCENLVLSTAPEDDFTGSFSKRISESGGERVEECCMDPSNASQLNTYIQVATERRIRKNDINGLSMVWDEAKKWQSQDGQNPMALFFAAPPLKTDDSTNIAGFQTIKEFSEEGDKAFRYAGISRDHERGRIRLMIPGLYLVSSHVSFRKPSTSSNASYLLGHRIMSESTKYDQSLSNIHAQDMQEKQCERQKSSPVSVSCHTSTLIVPVRIRANDEVYVQVTHKNLMHLDRKSTFLSIRKLS